MLCTRTRIHSAAEARCDRFAQRSLKYTKSSRPSFPTTRHRAKSTLEWHRYLLLCLCQNASRYPALVGLQQSFNSTSIAGFFYYCCYYFLAPSVISTNITVHVTAIILVELVPSMVFFLHLGPNLQTFLKCS